MENKKINQPLVSVIIPFYSGLNWLEEAIDSVLAQTYKNIEILVINDGSKEDISKIIKKYSACVKIINKKNEGPASARNMGIKLSSGKYIAFLDSDDLWLPDKLLKQINFMESKKHIWSQHSYEKFWDNNNKPKVVDTQIYSGNVYKDCFISFKIQTSCVVVLRKFILDKNIYFPFERRYGEDGVFYRKIAQKKPLGYIKGVYSRFRIRKGNAGFRAKVQIDCRGKTWEEIKKDKETLKILPRPVIFAYKISNLFSKFVNYINNKYIKNEKVIEAISKAMYVFPYVIFKIYSKK